MRRKGSIGLVSVVGLASLSLLGLIGWGILAVQAGGAGSDLEGLSESEKAELAGKRERFERLSSEEQQRYREFHAQLENHPESVRLTRILMNYDAFLQSLTSIERAKLADLPLDEKIAEVQSLKFKQDWQAFNRLAEQSLTSKDFELLFNWIGQVALDHEAELQVAFYAERPEFDTDRLPKTKTDRMRFWSGFIIGQLGEDTLKIPSDEELIALGNRLSPSAQKLLDQEEGRQEKLKMVRGWLFVGWMSMRRNTISEAELERFFNEKLTEEDRQTLDQKSPEDRINMLREMYMRRRMNRPGRGGNRPNDSAIRGSFVPDRAETTPN